MALIRCSECGKHISDKATICVHCGIIISPKQIISEGVDKYFTAIKNICESYLREKQSPDNHFDKVVPLLRNEIKQINAYVENTDDLSVVDELLRLIITYSLKSERQSSWITEKNLFELIEFENVSHNVLCESAQVFIKHMTSNSIGYIVYWYPIYQIMQGNSDEARQEIIKFLNRSEKYDLFIKMVDEHLYEYTADKESEKFSSGVVSIKEKNIPKCPTCGSTNIKRLDFVDRGISVGILGLSSNKINKSFQCKNCKYTW